MPTPTKYTKGAAFFTTSSGAVAPDQLAKEIADSASIAIKLVGDPSPVVGGGAEFTFADALPAGEETALEAICAAHTATGLQLQPLTSDGRPRVQQDPREGDVVELYSINWCDKTTWWGEAVKVENATLRATADPKVFEFVDTDGTTERTSIIDVTHAKITQEGRLVAEYAPKITVSGTPQTEREFAYDPAVVAADGRTMENGDYVIDYTASPATITFHNTPAATPVATYYYAYSSGWYVTPKPGKKLDLLAVETGLSEVLEQNDTVVYQPQIMAAAAAAGGLIPATILMSQGGDLLDTDYINFPIPNPSATSKNDLVADPDMIHEYKTIDDFLNEAQRSHPKIARVGTNIRSMKSAQFIMRWPYSEQARRELAGSQYTRIRVYLKYDQPFTGDKAVMSVYAISEDDLS
jgi:hypothetical protein